jgi:hypothetical protein
MKANERYMMMILLFLLNAYLAGKKRMKYNTINHSNYIFNFYVSLQATILVLTKVCGFTIIETL